MIQYENKYFIFDRPRTVTVKEYLRRARNAARAFLYKLSLEINRPAEGSRKKYAVSLCAIFRNEAPYMKEWIEYHRLVGVEHFYLYNNFSDDNYKDVLRPYIEKGIVRLIEWPVEQGQMRAYADCYSKNKNETKWIGYMDLDEFIVPTKQNNVYDVLKKFEKNRPSVLFYWKLFGTSGKIDRDRNGLVTEDFTVCWEKYDTVGKCFFNTRYGYEECLTKDMHCVWGVYRGWKLPPVNFCDKVCFPNYNPVNSSDFPIQINHYFTKSYEEYRNKMSRGDAFFKINPRDMKYFYRHEMLCKTTDFKIYKYLTALKLRMGEDEGAEPLTGGIH